MPSFTFKSLLSLTLLLTACPDDTASTTDDTDDTTDSDNMTSNTEGVSSTTPAPTTGDDSDTSMPVEDSTSDDSTSDDSTSTGDDSTSDTSDDSTSTGDDSTSTGESTGLDWCFGLDEILNDPEALDVKCEKHPWERLPECSSPHPMPTCPEMLQILADHEDCNELTWCDYKQCADALAKAPCEKRPVECDPITACMKTWMPSPGVDPTVPSLDETFAAFLSNFFATDAA